MQQQVVLTRVPWPCYGSLMCWASASEILNPCSRDRSAAQGGALDTVNAQINPVMSSWEGNDLVIGVAAGSWCPQPARPDRCGRSSGLSVCDRLHGQPGAVGGEAAGGEVVESDAVLEVADGILDLDIAEMVDLEIQRVAVPVGDEGV